MGVLVERKTGVEPATSSLARRRSTTELLPLDASVAFHRNRVALRGGGAVSGAEGQNRTGDTSVFSAVLYP